MELSTLSISESPFILSLSFLFLVFNGARVRAIPQDDFVEGERNEDNACQISRDLRTKRHQTRRERLAKLS